MTAAEALKPFQTGDQIVAALTVTDFPELISRKNMLPLIIFSIVFGICTNMIGEKGRVIATGLEALSEVFLKIVGLLMYYAPIGLGAYFAALIGEHGKELLGSYARAMAIYYPLCITYMFTAFPLYAWISGGMEGVRKKTKTCSFSCYNSSSNSKFNSNTSCKLRSLSKNWCT